MTTAQRNMYRLKMSSLWLLTTLFVVWSSQTTALDRETPFDSIDGGTLTLTQWEGQPVLVVNTASMCVFTEQYRELQALYDRYRDQGLIVLAVPSDDFNQELASDAEVKEFCELIYGIDMPMTVITGVKGRNAHPFYQSLRQEAGFTPRWNFNKVLLDHEGQLVETFASRVRPLSDQITQKIDSLLSDVTVTQ
jgi:glutathione peroxidase